MLRTDKSWEVLQRWAFYTTYTHSFMSPTGPIRGSCSSLSNFPSLGKTKGTYRKCLSPVYPFFELNEALPPLKPILQSHQFFPTGFICDPLSYGGGLKLAGHLLCARSCWTLKQPMPELKTLELGFETLTQQVFCGPHLCPPGGTQSRCQDTALSRHLPAPGKSTRSRRVH